MLQLIDLKERNAVGFRVNGTLAFDAMTVSSKHLISYFEQNGNVGILLEVKDTNGEEFWDMWRSTRYALAHLRQRVGSFGRIAVVSDADWPHRAGEYEYQVLSGTQAMVFTRKEMNRAMDWIACSRHAVHA